MESKFGWLLMGKIERINYSDSNVTPAMSSISFFFKNQFDDNEAAFNQWIEDGVIEDVSINEIEEKSHYLPHRGVFKELSTTKVRPVFDVQFRKKIPCIDLLKSLSTYWLLPALT
ncbi:hypothetical protein NPIL_362501 [Nephila pilipes]|uniref:Uncharacterized protein n=1 Tax=Nephila pilipes TaxID=299642 RepID=A0A8X6P431_NEPPI|nr:hypothetical protein NPIL_362501 [Nephila pilipes]